MTKLPSAENPAERHRRTRANRQEAGVVSVLLHLPPALAQRLDRERGTRPRTEVALQWLLAQAGLEDEAARPPLRRGRPRKAAMATVAQAQAPAPPEPLAVEPVSLRLVDWQVLLKQVPDPRRQADTLPEERVCWRREGSDGLTRLRWRYQQDDPRVPYIKGLGARWEQFSDCFTGRGAWVLDPQQADRCIAHFQLVDLQPAEEIQPRFGGWSIDVVDCGPQRRVLMEARVDFRAALSAAAEDPALALGLARWLECRRSSVYRWYQVKAASGDLPKGMLICEPLLEDELPGALSQGPGQITPAVSRAEAPSSWCQARATVVLQGQETPDGLVQAQPHTGCPGHRVGSLFGPFLEATADKRDPLLLRAEWDLAAERARLFGVATEFVPKPPSNLTLAFEPAKVPGWETPAQGGQRLFPFQQEAVRFALDQDLRCLIGDEMGLGKTASAVASAHAAGLARVLVVCPLNAVGVWQREIVAWSGADQPEPKVIVIRATDEAPAIPEAGWVLIGYETLAGRDERLEVEEVKLKDALCAFFTAALGKASHKSTGSWQVSQSAAEKAGRAKSKGAKWVFTIGANPPAAKSLQNQLAREHGSWLDTPLRQKLGRMAARLGRPVITALQAWNPQLVVADEAHRVKAATSRRTRAVRVMCAGRRVLLLTGTPLRNHAGDAKALLEILLPERIWKVLGRDGQGTLEVVKDLLARRMIRRRKKEVLKELPPKLRQRIPVRVKAAKLAGYVATMNEAEERFAKTWQQTGSTHEARQAAMGLWSQARRELGLAKLDTGIPVEYICEVIEAKGCAIVFAHHLDVLTCLETKLQEADIRVGRVDGHTKPAARTEIVQRFQAGKLQVFLGGLLAAGEAITLTRAETVIFVELAWVPGELLQAEDRGHRAGQSAPKYHIVHLIAEIDPPPTPKPPEGLEPPIPLPELLPQDYRRYEQTGVKSPAWEAAESKMEQDWERWDKYEFEQEQAQRLAAAENIDQHMIDALDAKVAHIDAVLGEESDAMVAGDAPGAGMVRLAEENRERVQSRHQGKRGG